MAQQAARTLSAIPVTKERRYDVVEGRKNVKRHNRIIRLRTTAFLLIATVAVSCSIMYYLTLQSDITNSIKSISKMESQLNELRLDNDENYSRITSNVNLEEVRNVAIQELGMRYAEEGQIITFNGEGSDYVRQTGSIPD